MNNFDKKILITATLLAAITIAMGAFGAHGLKNRVKDPNLLNTWNTASNYHLTHSIVLLTISLMKDLKNKNLISSLFLG